MARLLALFAVVALALAFAIYFPVRHFDFLVLDDAFALKENPWLKHGLSWPGIRWAFLANLTEHSPNAEYWQPLTLLSRLADAQFFGLDPGAFHITSALLHLVNAFLVVLALHRLTGNATRAAMVGLIFLVHPQNVEPVCWLAARKDLMNATFALCTLWAYGWYAQAPTGRRYALVLLAYLACLASKPMGVSLPFVLLILDWWPLQRWPGREKTARLLAEKLPLLVMAGLAAALAVQSQADWGAVGGTGELPIIYRVQNAVVSYALYVKRFFWPGDLAIYYPHPVKSLSVAAVLAAGIALAAITFAGWQLRKRAPVLLAGWLWFGVTLGPVIGLMQIGAQAMADRYFYLSGIGLILATVWLVAEFTPRRCQPPLIGAALSAFALLASIQVQTWRDSHAAFDHALMVTRGNSMAHLCLGAMEAATGPLNDARAHLRRAGEISPSMTSAWETLGHLEAKLGHDRAAIKAYAGALSAQPKNTRNMVLIGCLLKKVGELDKAESVFKHMRETVPEATEAWFFLGDIHAEQKRWPEAIAAWREYLATHPQNASVRQRMEAAQRATEAPRRDVSATSI